MIDALIVSQILLWFLVVILTGLVLVLARQVGVLHERIAPVGALALSKGPTVGEAAPNVAVESLTGRLTRIGAADPSAPTAPSRLLFFLSPRCPVCKNLLPTIQRLAAAQNAELIYASDGLEEDHAAYAREQGLDPDRYFVSTELGLRYQIAKLPYAVLIDAAGTIRAQGIVNTREHVESLFEAEALGVATLQDYLRDTATVGWEEEARA